MCASLRRTENVMEFVSRRMDKRKMISGFHGAGGCDADGNGKGRNEGSFVALWGYGILYRGWGWSERKIEMTGCLYRGL